MSCEIGLLRYIIILPATPHTTPILQVQGPLLEIVEQSRRLADILHPASAVELLGNTDPDSLPPAVRVSTAYFDASGNPGSFSTLFFASVIYCAACCSHLIRIEFSF